MARDRMFQVIVVAGMGLVVGAAGAAAGCSGDDSKPLPAGGTDAATDVTGQRDAFPTEGPPPPLDGGVTTDGGADARPPDAAADAPGDAPADVATGG